MNKITRNQETRSSLDKEKLLRGLCLEKKTVERSMKRDTWQKQGFN